MFPENLILILTVALGPVVGLFLSTKWDRLPFYWSLAYAILWVCVISMVGGFR